MSNAGLTIFDGEILRSIDLNLQELEHGVTGAQLLEISESKVSESLSGLSLPPHLKQAAISEISEDDDVNFRLTEFSQKQASEKLGVFISTVADALKENPIVVSILDGSNLKMFWEDEDDFAMLAENLFTDLDEEDKGKLPKSDIRKALIHMGVEMGVPPLSDFPILDDIIKKHDADGDEELGQAQFAELLQPVLQEIADVLHEKPITIVVQNVEIFTGSRLRKILADENKLESLVEKMIVEKDEQERADRIKRLMIEFKREVALPQISSDNEPVARLYETKFSQADENSIMALVEKTILEESNEKDKQEQADLIKSLIIKNGKEFGLPPLSSDNESVALLYETIFSQLDNKEKETNNASKEEGFMDALKDVLKKFEELLDTTPVYSATHL